MSVWKFGLCTLDGTAIGEITKAYERKWSHPLNGLDTASVKLRLDDPLADEILSRDGDVLLKVYRDSTLEFVGDLTIAEEVGEEAQTLACNFAGPLWRLQKRLAWKVLAGFTHSSESAADIAATLISGTNLDKDTGIRLGLIESGAPVQAGPWTYKPIAEALGELSAARSLAFDNISKSVADSFLSTSGGLSGNPVLIGTGNWSGTGDASDFQSESGSDPVLNRTTLSDASNLAGRYAFAGTDTFTNVTVQVDFQHDPSTGGTLSQHQGVIARCDGTANNWAMASVAESTGTNYLVMAERVGGGALTTLQQKAIPALTAGWYTIRLQIDDSGRWAVWFSEIAAEPKLILFGTRAAFATAGSLASGRVGIYDACLIADPVTRRYDDFWAAIPPYQLEIADDFDSTTGSLSTNALIIGTGTWSGTGDATDFAVLGGADPIITRTEVSDASNLAGRYAFAGTSTYSDVMVQTDFYRGSASSYAYHQGVFARSDGTANNWIMANVIEDPPRVIIAKRVAGGAFNTLAYADISSLDPTLFYSLRLTIDSSGRYAVWFWQVAEKPTLCLAGTDADLETGGALETGRVGLYDANLISTALTRGYDDFYVGVPANVLSWVALDFELVPSEPTNDGTDVDGAAKIKVATFNAYRQLGQTTTAVFEYGGGNRSVKSYRRVLSKEGLLNRAYSLPGGEDSAIEEQVKIATDTTSVFSRGLFEEVVPSDLQSPVLRQALVDAHVGIRSGGRQIITFEPSQTAPLYGTDYEVGDFVTGRATVNGTVRFNAEFRVYGVELTIDDEGKEALTLTLVPG